MSAHKKRGPATGARAPKREARAKALSYLSRFFPERSTYALSREIWGGGFVTEKGNHPEAHCINKHAQRKGWIGPGSACPLRLDNPDRAVIAELGNSEYWEYAFTEADRWVQAQCDFAGVRV